MQRPAHINNHQPSNEISLRELIETLWTSKLLIILSTVLVTGVAAVYVFLVAPTYEATVRTLPPTASDLAMYNAGSQLTGKAISGMLSISDAVGIEALSPADVYKAFLLRLTSNTVRKQFFDQFYLPAHDSAAADNSVKQQLWRQLERRLSISIPASPKDYLARVTLEGKDPEMIALWANNYVDIAIVSTRKSLLHDLSDDVQVRKKAVVDQIDTLRKIAKITRKERIVRLESAVKVAKSIGLEVPPPGIPMITVGTAGNSIDALADGSMMYLRGSKALSSELTQLQQRQNDDAYIPELTDLLKKQALLNSIDLNPEHLRVAIIDEAAEVPVYPIKPRKLVILALGVLLGGLFGVFLVFARRSYQKS